ncbi:MAG: hypothetical protein LAT64_13795 [Phycisphaerales bacterium]|nr:hypothetical protein [Planctomycetota bacterium]MCH8509823.1 hypothetical protein [Phycisphaerales bacterium]
MWQRLFHLYQTRRVVNINANVTFAGLVAIILAKWPVMLVAGWIGEERAFLISLAAYFIDMVFDFMVYFTLHWMANHWKPGAPAPIDRARIIHFAQDALVVQAERIVLVPLFAIIAIGGMWQLQAQTDIAASWAFVIAYLTAIFITRILHTIIGYRTGTFDDRRHSRRVRLIELKRLRRARQKSA